MKLILHVGMTKTGSTALQQALTGMSRDMVRRGVLYPAAAANHINHNFLTLAQCTTENLPRMFARIYGGREELIKRDFERNWSQVRKQVEQHKPHKVVLSSESLFKGFGLGNGQAFRELLAQLSDDITVVAYVRQPSAHYLSSAQQRTKSTGRLKLPAPVAYRAPLEMCEQLFGADRVQVVPYDQGALVEGDITRDFIERFLPELAGCQSAQGKTVMNQSISAESMAILQDYWETFPAGADYANPRDSKRLLFLLHRIEQRHHLAQRPVLKPGIGEFIDQASVDLLWLHERYGIRFPGVDYGAIREQENPYQHLAKVSEVCVVDDGRKQEIMMRALQESMSPRVRMPVVLYAWLRRHAGSRMLRLLRAAFRFNRLGI